MGQRKGMQTTAILTLLLGGIGTLLLTGLTNGHNWGGDFSAYILQAKSIVDGDPRHFIEVNSRMMTESMSPVGPDAYPWGLPVLLAPVYAIFGLNVIALKLVGAVCFLLFLALLWIGFRQHHSVLWRVMLICLFGLNPTMLKFVDQILSDIPFLLLSTLSVMLIGVVVVEKRRLISRCCDLALLGVAIAAAFLIRTNGLILLVTLGITQLVVALQNVTPRKAEHKDWKTLIRSIFPKEPRIAVSEFGMNTLPHATFIVIVLIWRVFLPEGGSSHALLLEGISPDIIKDNFYHYLTISTKFFVGVSYYKFVYGVTILFAVMGMLKRYKSDYHMIVYMFLTILLYLLWPFTQGLRFLFPILPFYFSFVMTSLAGGVPAVSKKREWSRAREAICILCVIVVLFYFGRQSVINSIDNLNRNRASSYGPFAKTSTEMFSFVEENTEPESTVIFFKPRVMRLMTGRKSTLVIDSNEISRGDYLCLYFPRKVHHQISPHEAEALAGRQLIKLLYRNRDFAVYRLTR